MSEIKTPICDFVKSYADKKTVRFHMPGHKGVPGVPGGTAGTAGTANFISALNAYDITEIEGADYLYEPRGIIKESEEIAAKVYGVPHTFYSTEGSSLCIKAMLSLSCKPGGKVIALTNAHRAFTDGCKLLGLTPVWIEDITALPAALRGYPDADAVFITSPDYLGEMIDVKETAKIVKDEFGKTLLHDCAHGAYLFLRGYENYTKGADLICTSAHKTLPVLTGGAYLHVRDEKFAVNAAAAMKPFASTSPSYLTLMSLDMCNKTVSGDDYKRRLEFAVIRMKKIKNRFGIDTIDTSEPLKICFKPEGDVRRVFGKYKIEPEIINRDLVVLMASADNTDADFGALEAALSEIKISPVDKKTKIQFIYTE